MSEKPPSPAEQGAQRRPKDERDELLDLEAKAERKRFEVQQNEAFGKYDVTVPGSAEVTYEEYLAQRPSDGIFRDSSGFRQSESGQFSSREAFDAQNSSIDTPPLGYYGKVNGIEENSEYVAPDYENMRAPELVLAAAKAEMIGDVAEVDDIRKAFEHLIMDDATTPGSTMTDKDFQDEINRFAHRVELAKEKVINKTGEQPVVTVPVESDGEAVVETVVAETEQATDHTQPEVTESETVVEQQLPTNEVVLNGEKVIISETFRSENGIVHEVTNADGSKTLVRAEDLTTLEPASEPETEKEKESATERLKDFWKKGKNFIKEKFSPSYIAAQWTMLYNDTINRGIDMGTDFQEADKIRNRNRIILIAGVAAVALASHLLHQGGSLLEGVDTSGLDPGPLPSGESLSPEDQAIADLRTPTQSDGSEIAPVPEVLPPAPEAAFNIPGGGGGIQLFESLGLDQTTWNENAQTLLNNGSGDFYRMEGGDIGVTRPGVLSQTSQDFINSLRR